MVSDLAVLILSSSINIVIGLLVLFRNLKRTANISFALTSFLFVLWSTLNFLTQNNSDNNLILTRFTGLVGALLVCSFYALSTVFPQSLRNRKKLGNYLTGISLVIFLLCMTPYFVQSTALGSKGLEIKTGPLYFIYPLYLLTVLGLCVRNFIHQHQQSQRLAKSQLRLLWLGILITVGLILLSNVLMPAITNSWSSSRYGTLFTVPFVAITAYAILKRHMFDVRLLVARIVAYAITLGIIVIIYSLILTTLVAHLVAFNTLSVAQIISLAPPTIISALTFQTIKSTVDRFTLRVFYRNAYQTRDVLDKLSATLTIESNISKLTQGSMGVIEKTFLPTTLYLAILDESAIYKDLLIGAQKKPEVGIYIKALQSNNQAIYVKDGKNTRVLSEAMISNGHSLILRLGSSQQMVGFLCLGDKKSGVIYTTQDIQLLKVAANNLAVALENAKKYEQISHFADTLKTEVAHATERLRHANERLKTLDQLKDDFISIASHQFRTPAASIRQALQMINDPRITEKDRKEILKLAEANSQELVTIVGTMLSISRLQAGRFTIDKTPTDLVAVVEKELETTTILAEQKDIKLAFNKPGRPIVVGVDAPKLKEAIANYIENAIKYSPNESTVNIELYEKDERLYFEVSDHGMGVPEDERKNLFTKFYRAQNARRQQPDGNGIGLYVVKSIAEGHGGAAYFRPQKEGGSVFGLWVPISKTIAQAYQDIDHTGNTTIE